MIVLVRKIARHLLAAAMVVLALAAAGGGAVQSAAVPTAMPMPTV